LAKDHPDIAVSCHNLGWFYHERGDYFHAEPLYREALSIREKIPGAEGLRLTAATMQNLAWMAANDRNYLEAEKLFKRSLEIRRKLHGDLHREVVYCKLGIAFVLIEQLKYVEALPIILTAQAEFNQVEENRHLTEAVTAFALGLIYRSTLGLRASETQLRKSLAAIVAGLGPDNGYVALVKYELASTLEELGNATEAEDLYRDALKIAREKAQMQHPRIALLVGRYASLLASQNRTEEGKALWEEFLKAQRGRFGDDNRIMAEAVRHYASFQREIGEYAAARKSLQEAIRILERQPNRTEYWIALNEMGLSEEEPQAAEACFRKILESEFVRQMTMKDVLTVQINLATALLDQQKWEAAEEILVRVREQGGQLAGRNRTRSLDSSLSALTRVYLGKRDAVKAVEMIEARSKLIDKDADQLYGIAIQLARCAKLVAGDGIAPSEQQKNQQIAYIDQSIGKLREALAAGLKNVDGIKTEKAFLILRDHPDFQKLLAEMKQSPP
jgi:tetratricopeptide (TPR) repeat protein